MGAQVYTGEKSEKIIAMDIGRLAAGIRMG